MWTRAGEGRRGRHRGGGEGQEGRVEIRELSDEGNEVDKEVEGRKEYE